MTNNFDELAEINYSINWPYIPNHSYRISLIAGSGCGKTNVLLNLVKHQWPFIDKSYWYLKDSFESMHQSLINGRENVGIKELKNWIIHKQLMMSMKI